MTRATREGVSESRQASRWRVSSREGVHVRDGLVWLEAEMRARLIRVANSVAEQPAFIFTGKKKDAETWTEEEDEHQNCLKSIFYFFFSLLPNI